MSTVDPVTFKLKTGELITIRAALPRDAKQIVEFTHTILSTSPGMITQAHEYARSRSRERVHIRQQRDEPGRLTLVAMVDRELVGHLDFRNGGRERNAHVGSLGMSVLPDWRRQGIGRAMLEVLLSWAEASPLIEKVALTVFANNTPALSLYESMQFQVEGRRPDAFRLGPNEYTDAVMMFRFAR